MSPAMFLLKDFLAYLGSLWFPMIFKNFRVFTVFLKMVLDFYSKIALNLYCLGVI